MYVFGRMKGINVLTPEALRAARALLKWGVREAAAAAGVSWMTVHAFENGRPMRASTAKKLVAAFEAHGVELVAAEDRTGAILVFEKMRP